MKKIEVILSDIRQDKDGKGISIPIKEYVEVDGQKYYDKAIKRRAFRTELIEEVVTPAVENEAGEIVTPKSVDIVVTDNHNFNAEVDEWTGVTDFLTTVYNF